jgi:RimJ/RimL family protein N-acetyltransferase
MSSFLTQYDFLSASAPNWGRIAILPWDEQIFGFAVADLELGAELPAVDELRLFRQELERFCSRTKVQLVSTRMSGDDTAAIALFADAGFVVVDFSLTATLQPLKQSSLPRRRFSVRTAVPEDHASICRLAGNAFHFGRYHTDPRFPRDLANARYVQWMRTALKGTDPTDIVFVLGSPGEVVGFMDVVVRNRHADLRLGAVDPERASGLAGFSLYVETLRALLELGTKSVSAKIAAANTRAMNIYSALGFQFSRPEVVLHWHSLGSTLRPV